MNNEYQTKSKNFLEDSEVEIMKSFEFLHEKGYNGENITVGIFDTGLNWDRANYPNVVEIINFTDEEDVNDHVGHGNSITSVK